MRFFLSIILFISCYPLLAQPGYRVFEFIDPSLQSFSIGAQVGQVSYYGDLCATNDCYTNGKLSTGLVATARLNDYIFFNLNGIYYRIEGSDASSGSEDRMPRNLSFRSDNFEMSFVGNFEFLNYNTFRYITRKEFPLSVFAFTGVGFTTNNPKTLYKGTWYDLRPLQTEGRTYSPISLVAPFGVGFGYRQSERLNFNLTIGYRYAFTDYLDDVSTTYQNPNSFSDPIALELQYRGDEIPFGRKGSIRGNPKSKDGYMIVGLKCEYKFNKIKLDFINFGSKSKYSDAKKPNRKVAKSRRN